MSKAGSLFGREPALFYGVIQAAITMLVAFGLQLDANQIGAILTFTSMVLAFATRQSVVPNSTHEAQVSQALETPPPNIENVTTLSEDAAEVKEELEKEVPLSPTT